ncbi:unnamed protein product [Xylocopa violacea]|uniref:Uncharacterized protein n=1 Tax=Xylocopa violacea TaxID=135666 RepID=A0ABP1P714_XYLVO
MKSKRNQISPPKPRIIAKPLFLSVRTIESLHSRVSCVRVCVCVYCNNDRYIYIYTCTYICKIYIFTCMCFLCVHTYITSLGITCVPFMYVRIQIHVQIINVYFTCAIIVLVERNHPHHPSLRSIWPRLRRLNSTHIFFFPPSPFNFCFFIDATVYFRSFCFLFLTLYLLTVSTPWYVRTIAIHSSEQEKTSIVDREYVLFFFPSSVYLLPVIFFLSEHRKSACGVC